ncbi:MAG TPA: hypothetical protein VJ695_01405 [Nitrososphaera sp.]|nr:hypothetical protein [Nitrososphaera sp.]
MMENEKGKDISTPDAMRMRMVMELKRVLPKKLKMPEVTTLFGTCTTIFRDALCQALLRLQGANLRLSQEILKDKVNA